MPRLKPKALSNPPSQPRLEGGLESATTLTPLTVAHPASARCLAAADLSRNEAGEV